ncbi:hypothetical protein [uncultured Thermosynechococcus sp.]|uniref:hypothetical protein n=1 Tax=uncultured Thermosynechococcus sp. TaxID=436945 RepID=UPI0026228859|nr:hypothetical protein [uncultured Thermosynechococcus sp.]
MQAPTPVIAEAPQYRIPPLMRPPTRLFNLETANILPEQTLELRGGIRNYDPGPLGQGGGLQIFYGSLDYAINNRTQVSFSANLFDDLLGRVINGRQPEVQIAALAAGLKYQIHHRKNLAIGVGGSLEALWVSSNNFLFVPTAETLGTWTLAGSLQFPITYSLSPQLQWHFTPNLTYFPDTVNKGGDFYGTNFNFGTGISWQPHPRFNLFADVNLPVGPGGNAVRSSDGAIVNLPVWSLGLRFLATPLVAIDLAATNGLGITPATRTLAFLPDADQVAIMAGLTYTPNSGPNFSPPLLPRFRRGSRQALTERDRYLLFNGLTLTSAGTLEPGMFHLRANTGTAGTGWQMGISLGEDAQFTVAVEQWERGETLSETFNYSPGLQFGLAAKLRFLDQTQGDPISLAIQGSFNHSFPTDDPGLSRGLVGAELSLMLQPHKTLALLVNPKVGLFTPRSKIVGGIGVGLNLELTRNLQFIAEATPVFGQTGVYSVGLRDVVPQWGLGIDLYGSNAAGSSIPNGGLVGQGSAGVGVNLHWLFGGSQRKAD